MRAAAASRTVSFARAFGWPGRTAGPRLPPLPAREVVNGEERDGLRAGGEQGETRVGTGRSGPRGSAVDEGVGGEGGFPGSELGRRVFPLPPPVAGAPRPTERRVEGRSRCRSGAWRTLSRLPRRGCTCVPQVQERDRTRSGKLGRQGGRDLPRGPRTRHFRVRPRRDPPWGDAPGRHRSRLPRGQVPQQERRRLDGRSVGRRALRPDAADERLRAAASHPFRDGQVPAVRARRSRTRLPVTPARGARRLVGGGRSGRPDDRAARRVQDRRDRGEGPDAGQPRT